jgi:hypothetical protein
LTCRARRSVSPRLRCALTVAVLSGVLCAPAAAAAPAPRKALLQARARVASIERQAKKRSLHNLAADAGKRLADATFKDLWISDHEVDAPSYGTNVFLDTARAVTDLTGLRASARTSLDLIVGADRRLAGRVISQAGRKNRALLMVARRALSTGDKEARRDHPAAAVRLYTKAWKSAFEALRQLIVARVTHVPRSALVAAAEEALGSKTIGLAGPRIVPGKSPLTLNGKPELFFAGSEACPYCGVERWGMIVALSQFGTFSNLHLMQSDTTESPSDRTFTFFGSSYRSPYISFVPVEMISNVRKGFTFQPLQKPTSAQKALIARFDPQEQTPFIDVANRFIKVQSTVQPTLIARKSWSEIASSLKHPKTRSAQAIAGTAEVLTAELCALTNGRPRSVCSAAVVKQYHTALPLMDGRGGGCPLPQASAAGRRHRGKPPRAGAARCHTSR